MAAALFCSPACAVDEATDGAQLFGAEGELDPRTRVILVDIDVDDVIQNAAPGDEVPEFVRMYNGNADYMADVSGEANLVTELAAGDEMVWKLGQADGVRIVSFDFHVVEGDDFLSEPGGAYPAEQDDGTWKAVVSPSAQAGSIIKYDVHFEIEGVGAYFWDPLIKIVSNPA